MKKYENLIYSLGASVVIIGALFKITHFQLGYMTGNVMLTVGLVTEAFIFAVAAFIGDEEVKGESNSFVDIDRERITRNIDELNSNMESLNEVYSSILKAHKCNR